MSLETFLWSCLGIVLAIAFGVTITFWFFERLIDEFEPGQPVQDEEGD